MTDINQLDKSRGLFSGSTLKIIACIAMFFDHFGFVIFPKVMIFRIIGRIAFPIFAYFVAEGCRYTRNKLKHFLLIFSVGVLYFVFYLVAFGQVYPSIFLTFSVSILNIYLIDVLRKYVFVKKTENTENGPETVYRVSFLRLTLAALTVVWALLASYIPFHYVLFDYGYIGMLAPVLMSLFDFSKIDVPKKMRFLDSPAVRLIFLAIICIMLALKNSAMRVELFGFKFTVQVFNLCSIPLLTLYNGKVGVKKLKYFFYAFYPLHLGVIMLIKIIIDLAAK